MNWRRRVTCQEGAELPFSERCGETYFIALDDLTEQEGRVMFTCPVCGHVNVIATPKSNPYGVPPLSKQPPPS